MLKTALLATLPLSLCLLQPLYAQSIIAAPDGTGTLIQIDGNTYHIQGGTQAGTNLFHSFQDFGLSAGEIANFLSSPDVSNIFGRVTGGNASMIDGLIQANPNLYLINPVGIVLGANASLNIGGDFFATTADQICFEGGCFNSVGVNNYHALRGSPNDLGFLQGQPGGLINAGTLEVLKGKSIHLSGGTVVNLGQILAPGGMATVAAIPGERRVLLNQPGSLLSLEVAETVLNNGIEPLALPSLLAGTSGNFNAKTIDAPLGNAVIEGGIVAEQVDLYAAGQVMPTNYELLQGDTTVVRFPETNGQIILSIIDARADNAQDLLFGGAQGTIATLVERTEDGIAAISDTLDRIDKPLAGMSITAEGNEGNFWLGNTWITHETVQDYQAQLAEWSSAFTESADLLLYSCFTALGETGEALLANLATGTGLDVAASTNATGSVNYGGDWVLEQSTGKIELQSPFTSETLANWDGKLATRTVTSPSNSGAFTLRDALEGSGGGFGSAPTAGDDIVFSFSGTISLSSAINWTVDNLTVNGSGQTVIVEGGGGDRIFNISANNATIQNLTIRNGSSTGRGGGIYHTGTGILTLTNSTVSGNSAGNRGGGISSNGAVTLTNATVSNNSAYRGGGINSNGAVTVTNSTVSNNSASGNGGGINGDVAGAAVTVINSTVSGNSANAQGGGIFSFGAVTVTNSTVSGNSSGSNQGGGIASYGATTVTNSTVSGNSANSYGGGILSFNAVTVTNSTVSGNSANRAGGGIASVGAVTLTNSTVSGNSSNAAGGGIFGNGDVTLTDSTVSGNSANAAGGGISSNGAATLTNSTVSGNSANSNGGAISSDGAVTATHSTIAFNSANGNGGGIYASNPSRLNNTIVANNSTGATGPDLFGTFIVNASLILDSSGATISGSNNILGQDPLLQPLANNGGSTQTHALPTGSPALDSGNNTLVTTTTDQRGEVRIFNGTVDIGAYEFVLVESSAVTVSVAARSDFETQTEGLTAACPNIPEVEIESELSVAAIDEQERDDFIELEEHVCPWERIED
ncbi:MAG: DUF4347 domain-containing protein [Cyanobacteria bacterium P01_G01_bin.54]